MPQRDVMHDIPLDAKLEHYTEHSDDSRENSTKATSVHSNIKDNDNGNDDNDNNETQNTKDFQNNNNNDQKDQKPQSRSRRLWKKLKWFLADQWFLLGVGIGILIASQVNVPYAQQERKSTIVSYTCVSFIFLVTGCTLPTRVLLENYGRVHVHLFVQAQCFLLTSAISFGIVSATATNRHFMSAELLFGILFGGCLPTTISSNVIMTRDANGNTALTVVQSTLGNFLSPFLVPLLLKMYESAGGWYNSFLPTESSGYGEIYRRVFKQLGLSIFLPMFVGQVLQYLFPKAVNKVCVQWKVAKVSSLALLVILWSTFDQAFGSGAFHSSKGSNMVFIVFMSPALFLIWLAAAFALSVWWLPRKDVIAICYCVPAKSIAIGVPLSLALYNTLSAEQQSMIQIPGTIFQAFQITFGSLLKIPLRKWEAAERARDEEQKPFDADAESV